MDSVMTHEKHRPRGQGISDVFNNIVYLAGKQENDFIELVKMEAFLLTGTVLQVEVVIVFIQIAFPEERIVFSGSHVNAPFCKTELKDIANRK